MDGQGSETRRDSRFSVVTRLGEGGMGCVYEALDLERNARVALKTLRRLDPEEVLRFKGEFRKLQDLHHPNLVSLGELVEEGGQWFFTMELVRGSDFLGYVRLGPVTSEDSATAESPQRTEDDPTAASAPRLDTAEQTLVLGPATEPPACAVEDAPDSPREPPRFEESRLRGALVQLVRGLCALHRASKVHRDIKPSNILVTEEGRVVLLDFGILSDVEEAGQGEVVGTAAYMAPEQTRGAAASPEADWYSVGVLLYEALTGRKPFLGAAREVMEIKRRVEPVPPQELVAGLPEDLCRLCTELLRIEPRQRPDGRQVLRRLGVEPEQLEEAWGTLALPFMGREAELQALHEALADSRQGASVVVRVEGESGVGKTRLVRRFLEQVAWRHPGALVLTGRCYERESVPYKGVDGLIDSLARHLAGGEAQELQELPATDAAALVRLFPVLGRVRALAGAQALAVPGDLLSLRLAAFSALRELLGRLAAQRPLVLSVDDLQWADRDSAALLDEVLQAPGLLLLATVRVASTQTETTRGRSAEVVDSRFWQQARTVVLRGLQAEEAQALVERLLADTTGPVEVEAERIVQESRGHPLFIDALVRHRRGEQGAGAPARLEEALWARACRLEASTRRLLELLSVAGGPLSHGVAGYAASLDATEYTKSTASLRSARLAVTTGPAASDTVEVVHDKVRQAVLPHLEPGERKAWHVRLASALEALGQGGAETLARHWREGGQVERALSYYVRAAREAEVALAFSRAAHLYQVALEVGAWEPAERRKLLLARAEALSHAGRGQAAAEAFLSAAEGAAPSEALALRRRAGEQYLQSGYVKEGVEALREVLAAVGVGYPETEGQALASLLWQRVRLQLRPQRLRLRETREVPAATLERLEVFGCLALCLGALDPLRAFGFQSRHLLLALESGERRHLCRALAAEATSKALRGPGQRAAVERHARQAAELAEQLEGDEVTRGFVLAMRATQCSMLGDFHESVEAFSRALEVLERCQEGWWERSVAWEAGSFSTTAQGQSLRFMPRLEQAVAEARERGDKRFLIVFMLSKGYFARLREDDVGGARQMLEEARALWTGPSLPMHHLLHLNAQANLYLYQEQASAALRVLAEGWRRIERARVLSFPFLRTVMVDLRARVRLHTFVQEGARQQELLRAVEADARGLERLGMEFSRGVALSLRAGVAQLRGREAEALALYTQAGSVLESTGALTQAMAVRVCQAELQGGEEGRALAARATEWLRQSGMKSLERHGRLLFPVPMRELRALPGA